MHTVEFDTFLFNKNLFGNTSFLPSKSIIFIGFSLLSVAFPDARSPIEGT